MYAGNQIVSGQKINEGFAAGSYDRAAQNAGYGCDVKVSGAVLGALPQSATEAEVTHFISRIQKQAAQLDELLVILGDRLRPITRQEPIAAQTESLSGRPTATEVGSTLSGINNHLRVLSDRVQWHLSTLEI
jgi:hypothetical protein